MFTTGARSKSRGLSLALLILGFEKRCQGASAITKRSPEVSLAVPAPAGSAAKSTALQRASTARVGEITTEAAGPSDPGFVENRTPDPMEEDDQSPKEEDEDQTPATGGVSMAVDNPPQETVPDNTVRNGQVPIESSGQLPKVPRSAPVAPAPAAPAARETVFAPTKRGDKTIPMTKSGRLTTKAPTGSSATPAPVVVDLIDDTPEDWKRMAAEAPSGQVTTEAELASAGSKVALRGDKGSWVDVVRANEGVELVRPKGTEGVPGVGGAASTETGGPKEVATPGGARSYRILPRIGGVASLAAAQGFASTGVVVATTPVEANPAGSAATPTAAQKGAAKPSAPKAGTGKTSVRRRASTTRLASDDSAVPNESVPTKRKTCSKSLTPKGSS